MRFAGKTFGRGLAVIAVTVTAGSTLAQEVSPRLLTGQLPDHELLRPMLSDREIFQPGTQPCTFPEFGPSCFHTDHTDDYDRKFHPAQGEPAKLAPLDELHPAANPVRPGDVPVATDDLANVRTELVCSNCHGNYDDPDTGQPAEYSPWDTWRGTMMAQAWRDPLARAAIAVANHGLSTAKIDYTAGEYNDGPAGETGRTAGDFCIRCHSPVGWLEGNSLPADGSRVHGKQTDGVQCDFCHRMVNPLTHRAEIPSDYDTSLLEAIEGPGDTFLVTVPTLHNGNFVINRTGAKIGPYGDPSNQGQHPLDACDPASALEECDPPPITTHPRTGNVNDPQANIDFLRSSQFCAVCHNVTNPVLNRVLENGTPVLVDGRKQKMPVERTYTEWYFSDFGPVLKGDPDTPLDPSDTGKSCQSCHMAEVDGYAATPDLTKRRLTSDPEGGIRQHTFVGGNTWAQDMIPLFFPDQAPLQPVFDAVQEKAAANLRAAATMSASFDPGTGQLRVDVTNETGHKLPTGYPEGRRMWLTVAGYDAAGSLVYESGSYDFSTAQLAHDPDLKLWAAELGIKKPGADLQPSFHFILNNVILLDNRIPPEGFDYVAAADHQTVVVRDRERDCRGYEALGGDMEAACSALDYDGSGTSDGRDVVFYDLSGTGATSVKVILRYQVASKEYVDFLSDPANSGAYFDRFTAGLRAAWLATGMSRPVDMSCATAGDVPEPCPGEDS